MLPSHVHRLQFGPDNQATVSDFELVLAPGARRLADMIKFTIHSEPPTCLGSISFEPSLVGHAAPAVSINGASQLVFQPSPTWRRPRWIADSSCSDFHQLRLLAKKHGVKLIGDSMKPYEVESS